MAGMRQYGQNLARGTIRGSRGPLARPARARDRAGGNRLRACAGITEAPAHARFEGPKHNDAAFLAYGLAAERGGIPMRLILGIILGAALTVGGAYISDTAAGAGAKPMVNWDVVAKNFDEVSAVTRAGWKKITG
jgi:hypothetical protein